MKQRVIGGGEIGLMVYVMRRVFGEKTKKKFLELYWTILRKFTAPVFQGSLGVVSGC